MLYVRIDATINVLWRFLFCFAACCVVGEENEDKNAEHHVTYPQCWHRLA